MRRWKNILTGLVTSIALFILIIDAPTAAQGIRDGIEICTQTAIPALFPFLILVPIICHQFAGKPLRFMSVIRKICKLPTGTEAILFFGLLGGYPMGAALIAEAYTNGQLHKADAQRMLGFCSNAGPAFLFGMVGPLFINPLIPWLLWLIHILSAIIVGFCTRADPVNSCSLSAKSNITIVEQVERSIKNMAMICAWVILFRMVSAYLINWILWRFPAKLQCIIVGILELSNGCILLISCTDESIKFLISSCLLAFGGLCVLLQTKSVCGTMGMGNYFPGKVLQLSITLLLGCLILPLLYDVNIKYHLCITCFAIVICAILIKKRKKLWKYDCI